MFHPDIIDGATGELVSLPHADDTSLYLPPDLPFEDWEAMGRRLAKAEKRLPWLIGDWWRYGHQYGERAKAAAGGIFGLAFQTLVNAGVVAGRFGTNRRRLVVPFSFHQEVAALPAALADELLDRAQAERWTKRDLRQQVSQVKAANQVGAAIPGDSTCGVVDLFELAAAGTKFSTIYADPPWAYDNQATRAATGNHYSGMPVHELCSLPVGQVAHEDAHLHLWTTNAFLFDCPRIFEAWGFEFKSSFVWVKSQIGIGNYWRNSHEILLTAVRGDATRFNDKALKSWLECDRGEHSSKPEQVRSFIERASPGPYLELFARGEPPNGRWAVWGNQIERSLFSSSVSGACA